jgi:hypothetical protein
VTPERRRAYKLADNKLALNVGWDQEILAIELQGCQLALNFDPRLEWSTPNMTCRFRNLDSSVPMMEPAKDRMRNNVSEPLDRAGAGRVLPKRNVGPHLVIINGIFRKDSAKVFRMEHDQMICALAPGRPDQALNISVLPGRAERRGPVTDSHCSCTRALIAPPNALSLSRMRYLGAVSHGNASVI